MFKLFLMLLCALAFAWPSPSRADDAGKAAFTAAKCNDCHSIKAEGVAMKEAEESLEAEEEDDEDAPDLSAVGKKHDADWITKYLKKKIKNDEGKKHKKRFKGSDEKLAELTTYLASLKTEAP